MTKQHKLDIDDLISEAKDRGVKLPRGKQECEEVIKSLIELVEEHSEGEAVDKEAVIAAMEHQWGLTVAAGKKRKAEIDARTPTPLGKKPLVNKEVMEWPHDDKGAGVRELAERLRLEAMRRNIALPETEEDNNAAAIVMCGQAIEGAKTDRGTVDVIKALEHLQERVGTDKEKKVRNYTRDVKVPENTELVESLRELAAGYFKFAGDDRLNRIKGAMLQRAATAIRDLDWAITPECMPEERGKSDRKVQNIGHDTIEYIRQFFETGKIDRLEEFKIRANE